jgi:molybdopterin-guanine dinucleotide biosynthesis protein A
MTQSSPCSVQVPALVLAAGRGERMRPLTDSTPKPLLQVQGRPLLQWHLQALANAGVSRVVINTAWLGEQIPAYFSDKNGVKPIWDKRKQLSISYSQEGVDFGGALETAGGIARALPQLGPVFWLAAGDVFAPDFVFDSAAVQAFRQRPARPPVAGAQPGAQPARRLRPVVPRPGAEPARRRPRAALHLQHHRAAARRTVRAAVVRHSARQPRLGVKAPCWRRCCARAMDNGRTSRPAWPNSTRCRAAGPMWAQRLGRR